MLARARRVIVLSLGFLTLIVSLSLITPVSASGESWDSTEIEIARSGYYETNPILGKHPSESRIRNHFILSTVGSYLISDNISIGITF